MPEDLFLVAVLLLCGGKLGSDGGKVDDGPRKKDNYTSNGTVTDNNY